MNIIAKSDVKKLCRICLKVQAHMQLLTNSELVYGKLCTLSEMISSCTSVQISLENELPNMICQFCTNRLYASYTFKMDCENSEIKLRQCLPNSIYSIDTIKEVNINDSAVSKCDYQTNGKNMKVLKMMTTKNFKNKLKIVKGNIDEKMKQKIVENMEEILKENKVEYLDSNCVFQHKNISMTNKNQKYSIETKNTIYTNVQLDNRTTEELIILNDPPKVSESTKNYIENTNQQLNLEKHYTNESTLLLEKHTKEDIIILDDSSSESESTNNDNKNKSQQLNLTNQTLNDNTTEEIIKDKSALSERKNDSNGKSISPKSKIKVNKCSYCSKIFMTHHELTKHFKMKHTGLRKNYCQICNKKFILRSSLDRHLKLHGLIRCPKCSLCFTSQHFEKHMEEHLEHKPFKCDLCCKIFDSQKGLDKHIKNAHSGINKYFCDICLKGFSLQSKFKAHKKMHDKNVPNKCNECNKMFASINGLTKHNNTIHSLDPPFKCNKCEAKFTKKSFLNQHKMEHREDNFFACRLCPKEFLNDSSLTKHMETHLTPERSPSCKICFQVFHSDLELQNHKKTHFCCKKCPSSFDTIHKLTLHAKTHSDLMPFKCYHCNKFFYHTSTLNKHILQNHQKQ